MEQYGGLEYVSHAPENGEAPTSVVFLLHGIGADANDLMGLVPHWKEMMPQTEFISPNAPQPCDMAPAGYQWFSLQERDPEKLIKGVQEAVPFLDGFIDAHLERLGLEDKDAAVVGFSQGTMLALYAMPRRKEACNSILGYSGALFDDGTLQNNPESLQKMPILLVHGTEDEVVAFSAFEDSGAALQATGFDVQGLACKGLGHGIDEKGLMEGGTYLAQQLKTQQKAA